MHEFQKTRFTIRDITKYNADILIYFQNMEVRGQFPLADIENCPSMIAKAIIQIFT